MAFSWIFIALTAVNAFYYVREEVFDLGGEEVDHTSIPDVLKLDTKIRDYVLLPISIVMFMQGILRANIAILMKSEPTKPSLENFQRAQVLKRAQKLRENGHFLTPEVYARRKQFFLDVALKLEEPEEKKETDELPQPNLNDMAGMTNMMKSNMGNILPNMLSIGWVSYFFSGFVLVKLPFPLTDPFKPMLQRGINLTSLDPSYVSSLSWYFLNLFGLRGVFSLMLGNDAPDDSAMAQMGPMPGAMPGAGITDPNKPIQKERDELVIAQHEFVIPNAQYRIMNEPVPDSTGLQ